MILHEQPANICDNSHIISRSVVSSSSLLDDELIKLAQSGDIKARDEILVRYNFVVEKAIFRLQHLNFDLGGKRYGAIVGIMRAIKNYDFRGKFGDYAYVCAVRRAEREISKEHLIKVPFGVLQDILKSYKNSCEDNWPYKMVEFTPEMEEAGLFTDTGVDDNELRNLFEEVFQKLKPLEVDAIKQKFGFTKETLKTVGEKHGVSNERVRQVGRQTLTKLSHIVKHKIKEKSYAA